MALCKDAWNRILTIIYLSIHLYMYVRVHIYPCTYGCISMYLYTYICMHMYIHMNMNHVCASVYLFAYKGVNIANIGLGMYI